MKTKYPRLFSYFKRYEKELRERAVYKRYFKDSDPIWSMFNTGGYTFAPVKVIWPNMGAKDIFASVIGDEEETCIPQHIVTLLPFESHQIDEAYYCAAVLNSTPFRLATICYSQSGGKSFGTPHILEYGVLPKYDASSKISLELVNLSREAHRCAKGQGGRALPVIEADIDSVASKLWGISNDELISMQQEIRELQG